MPQTYGAHERQYLRRDGLGQHEYHRCVPETELKNKSHKETSASLWLLLLSVKGVWFIVRMAFAIAYYTRKFMLPNVK